MPDLVRRVFLEKLPRILFFKDFVQPIDPLDLEIAKDIIYGLRGPNFRRRQVRRQLPQQPQQQQQQMTKPVDEDIPEEIANESPRVMSPEGTAKVIRNAVVAFELRDSSTSLPAASTSVQANENVLVLVESDDTLDRSPSAVRRRRNRRVLESVAAAKPRSIMKRPAKLTSRRERRWLELQQLVYRNIDYLNQIDNFIKSEFQIKKVDPTRRNSQKFSFIGLLK